MAEQLIQKTIQSVDFALNEFADLASYIRRNGLNDIEHEDDVRWAKHDANLQVLEKNLLYAIQIPNPEVIINSIPRPFESAKIAMSFYTRVRDLSRYDQNGIVRFPPSHQPL